jgi:hypothetical protein
MEHDYAFKPVGGVTHDMDRFGRSAGALVKMVHGKGAPDWQGPLCSSGGENLTQDCQFG